MLNYKGYQGSVTYDDGALVIQVLHIRDFISDECVDASEAESTFQRLVDDYLEHCRAVGKEPEKPFKGSFNVRMTPELHRSAALKAAESGCSLNEFVERAVASLVSRQESQNVQEELLRQYAELAAQALEAASMHEQSAEWQATALKHRSIYHHVSAKDQSAAQRRISFVKGEEETISSMWRKFTTPSPLKSDRSTRREIVN